MPAWPLLLIAAAAAPAEYRVVLDEGAPLRARFELLLPPHDDEAALDLASSKRSTFAEAPECDAGLLADAGGGRWRAPPSCRVVRWSVALVDHDMRGVNAVSPEGAWSAAQRWWLLTTSLSWIKPAGAPLEGRLSIATRWSDGRGSETVRALRGPGGAPFYGVFSALPGLSYRRDGVEMRVFGAAPVSATGPVQEAIADAWAQWRRDVAGPGLVPRLRFDIVWVRGAGPDYGSLNASAGDGGMVAQIPMQRDPVETDAQLRSGLLLIGARMGFRAILGALPGRRPVWAEESLASHFTYRITRARLDGRALAIADEAGIPTSDLTLLRAQAEFDRGCLSCAGAFYTRGARFWAAIEKVLTTRKGRSGRLGALIRDSNGFAGVDWASAESLATWLDARTNGKAAPIVRCYLSDPDCAMTE